MKRGISFAKRVCRELRRALAEYPVEGPGDAVRFIESVCALSKELR